MRKTHDIRLYFTDTSTKFERTDISHFRDYGLEFLTFRFWTGAWISVILILLVAIDFSASVAYITRFTEESFSVLISLIFMMEAFKVRNNTYSNHIVVIARFQLRFGCMIVLTCF